MMEGKLFPNDTECERFDLGGQQAHQNSTLYCINCRKNEQRLAKTGDTMPRSA